MVDVADFMSDCSRPGRPRPKDRGQTRRQRTPRRIKDQIRAGVATELADESLEDANRTTDAAKSAQRDAIAGKLGQRAATTVMALLFAAAGYG
jgi:hypothetical protein